MSISRGFNILSKTPYFKDEIKKMPYYQRKFISSEYIPDKVKYEIVSKEDKEKLDALAMVGKTAKKYDQIEEVISDKKAIESKNNWHSSIGGKNNKKTKRRKNINNTRRKKI